MLGEKPPLLLVSPYDLAHQEIVRPIVPALRCTARHGAGFLDHDLVRMEEPGHLDRRLFSPRNVLEQFFLAAKPMVEGALRDAGAPGHLLNTGGAETVPEKERRRDIEDPVRELRRLDARRPAAMAAPANRGALSPSWIAKKSPQVQPRCRPVARVSGAGE